MSEIHGATGSYVVDALDPDELGEFEAHLQVCPTCRREIAEFCETANQLSLLAHAPAPPPNLRDAVLSGISQVRPLPPLTDDDPGRALPGVRGLDDVDEPAPDFDADRAVGAVSTRASAGDELVADELALRRSHRRTRLLTGLVAAVTVIALALGGVVYNLARSQPPTAATAVDPSLVGAPDAKIYSKKLPNGAHVSYVVSKSQDRAVLVSNDLPSPGPGKTYQLWTLHGSSATPDQTFAGGPERTQAFRGPIKDSNGLAITIEAAAGAQQPTAPIMARVSI